MLGSMTTRRRMLKNCKGAALNFLTQYKEDGDDLLEQIITGDESWIYFYKPERKSANTVWGEGGKEEAPRKFKNEQSAKQVMLTAFWDYQYLVYAEFSSKARREK